MVLFQTVALQKHCDPIIIAQKPTYIEAHEELLNFIQKMLRQGWTATRVHDGWQLSRRIAFGLRTQRIDLDILLPSALLN